MSPITKDPFRALQLARPLSDAYSVAPLPSPECHYKYQADTTWPRLENLEEPAQQNPAQFIK
jgi:hypothetical protein